MSTTVNKLGITVVIVLVLRCSFPLVTSTNSSTKEAVKLALEAVGIAKELYFSVASSNAMLTSEPGNGSTAWMDCLQLYEDGEQRLRQIIADKARDFDAQIIISAAFTNHMTCLTGLAEQGLSPPRIGVNMTALLTGALRRYGVLRRPEYDGNLDNVTSVSDVDENGLLAKWHPRSRGIDIVVARDGSGEYTSINEALKAVESWRRKKSRGGRIVIYVKAGVYEENVVIGREMGRLMMVGDGMGRTVVTGRRSVLDGFTTFNCATFGVSGDGFWARDMSFTNTAGPTNHQAVALRVSSDHSVFYRCSFIGYQDTLFVHSGRQFYRECHIHGTIDFIFGNAAAVIQRCVIHIRKPMPHQSNTITAQGRNDPADVTGISVIDCQVVPGRDLQPVKGSFKTYLGRPWKRYSRTVFMKTDLDGLVHRRGWSQWRGRFALDTLYYGEYMNTGDGANTGQRVRWGGFHVMRTSEEAGLFTVRKFIQGHRWLPVTGVPFSSDL